MSWLATGSYPSNSSPELSPDGNLAMSMLEIRERAKRLGIDLAGIKCSTNELQGLSCPAIARVDGDHFLVTDCIAASFVRVLDGSDSPPLIARGDFERRFDGHALVPTEAINKSPNPTRVWADTQIVDLGRVGSDTEFAQSFVIHTNSTTPITVEDVRACCGTELMLAGGRSVAADKPLEAVYRFRTPGFAGDFARSAVVVFDGPRWPVIELSVAGRVCGKPTVTPAGVDFGKIKTCSSAESTVLVRYVTSEGAKDVQLTPSSKSLSVSKTDYDAGRELVSVTMRFDTAGLRGRITESLVVKLGEGKEVCTIRVPVFADVEGSVSLRPSQFMFGLVRVGTVASLRVKITHNQRHAFSILEVKAPANAKVRCLKIPEGYALDAQLQMDANSALIDDSIVVTTDIAEDREIRIPVYAMPDNTGSASKPAEHEGN
jgi:hypothetical protein